MQCALSLRTYIYNVQLTLQNRRLPPYNTSHALKEVSKVNWLTDGTTRPTARTSYQSLGSFSTCVFLNSHDAECHLHFCSLTRWCGAVRQRVINASLSPSSVDRATCVVPRGPTALIGATASHKLEGRVRVWRTESTALAFRKDFHAAWTSQSLGSIDKCSETKSYIRLPRPPLSPLDPSLHMY